MSNLYSQNINNKPIYTDGDQKVYERLQVCTCFREKLKKGENFSEAQAIGVMERNLNKRQAHGYANLLEDRFTLEKRRAKGRDMFRTWLGYREITDIRRSTTRPQFFVLSIQSIMSNRRYYEVYKCQSEEDSQKFETLVREALGNPDFRIHRENPFATMAVGDGSKRARSLVHIDFQSSLESLEEHPNTNGAHQQANSTTSEEHAVREGSERARSLVHIDFQSGLESLEEDPNTNDAYQQANSTTSEEYAVREGSERARSLVHIDFQSSLESLEKDSNTNDAYQQANSTASEEYAEKAPLPETTLIETYVHAGPPTPPSPVLALPVEQQQAAETERVTFIKFDTNTRQPVESDIGPAYMYMHRERFSVA